MEEDMDEELSEEEPAEAEITVLVVEPGKEPEIRTITDSAILRRTPMQLW